MAILGSVLRRVNWIARAAGFAWIGILAFATFPPQGSFEVAAQTVGYAFLGGSLLTLALLETQSGARYRSVGLPVVLAAMAASAGFGATVGHAGVAMIAFGFVATLIAGGELRVTAALSVTAVGILSVEIGALSTAGSYGVSLGLPTFLVAGLVVGLNRGAYRVRAEQTATLLAQQKQLQAEQRRIDLLDERARIAREIHDVLAHSLGALGIQIQAARAVLTDRGDADCAAELLTTAQQLAADGLAETRRAIDALRTDAEPLVAQLARASDAYAERYRMAVEFDATGDPVPVPPDAALALVRVTQEALVNAAKHSWPRHVAVRLAFHDAGVQLSIRNRLVAEPSSTPDVQAADLGYGLTGMRERLQLLRGNLDAGRHDSEWVVTAEVPLTALTR
jgi:signal transduction histidine kinase